jgi:hypothetical protein
MDGKLGKLLRNKSAITPVLSNLLLTVVAVTAMALATTATYVITNNLRDTMSERVVTEDVWFNSATNSIDIYLRNVGKILFRVSGVYINHTKSSFAGTFSLEVGGHGWFNISKSWNPADLLYIDIVTTRGTHISGYYNAL